MHKKNSLDIPQEKILMVREDLKGPPTLAEEELTPEETQVPQPELTKTTTIIKRITIR